MTISVCIPTYNQAAYVEKTIRSVMSQTLLPDEVIVSNDCSTDGTKEILDRLAQEFNILRVIHQPVNLGMSGNTNTCLRESRNDVIVKLDSDDLLLPDYIKFLSVLLAEHPSAGYAHAAVYQIDEKDNIVKERRLYRPTGFHDDVLALKGLLQGYRVAANILMFRREALAKVGYITNMQNFAEDFYLSVNIAGAGYGNVYCDKILASYRVWDNEDKVRQKRKLAELKGLTTVFNDAMVPAFKNRGWDIKEVDDAKEKFAVKHAQALSWSVFSKEEKSAIEEALFKLSPTAKTKRYISLYKSPLSAVLNGYSFLYSYGRQKAKSLAVGLLKKGKT